MTHSLQFDAVSEESPGAAWQKRWNRSWPAYRQWFLARGGEQGPSREDGEAALQRYMPELVPVWQRLTELAGGDDLSARFLSTWCPPAYLGGCSLAAVSRNGTTRLVRNYDLSPDLNEGLLLHSAWSGKRVMGMVEFLWGLSDGVNEQGLAVALAYGGRNEVVRGFGITTILRYLMETCSTVSEALLVLDRVPSHMAYNIALADKAGTTASVELQPGGGYRIRDDAVATNHQHGSEVASRPAFTRTVERLDHLHGLFASRVEPLELADEFLKPPLFQTGYTEGLGTLFTADYDPASGSLQLRWTAGCWQQSLADFREGSRVVVFSHDSDVQTPALCAAGELPWCASWLDGLAHVVPYAPDPTVLEQWLRTTREADPDWALFATLFSTGSERYVADGSGQMPGIGQRPCCQ